LDRVGDAILQFEDIEKLNPDNDEVKQILSNLRNGDKPLLNVGGSSDISDLPVDES